MVKESAGSQEQGKGNSSLLSKDRPEGGWKWKVGIAGLDMLGWTVCVSRARVCDELLCLLCDFIMEPVLHVPQASVSIWSPGYGGDAILLLCFVFSEVQQPTDRTTSPCFWFMAYSKPEHLKVKLKIFTRRKKKTTPDYKWNQIIGNARCERGEDSKIIFVFYPVLHNQKSSLDFWGRAKGWWSSERNWIW